MAKLESLLVLVLVWYDWYYKYKRADKMAFTIVDNERKYSKK